MDARKKKNKKKKPKSGRNYAEFVDEERVAHKPEGIRLFVQGKAPRGASSGGNSQPGDMWLTQPEPMPPHYDVTPSTHAALAASLPCVAAGQSSPEADQPEVVFPPFQTFSTFGKSLLHGNQSSSMPSLPSATTAAPHVPRRPLSGEISGIHEFRYMRNPDPHVGESPGAASPQLTGRACDPLYDTYQHPDVRMLPDPSQWAADDHSTAAGLGHVTGATDPSPIQTFPTETSPPGASSSVSLEHGIPSLLPESPTKEKVAIGHKREQGLISSPVRQRKILRPSAPPPPVPMATSVGAPAAVTLPCNLPVPTRKAPPPPIDPATIKPPSPSKIPRRMKTDPPRTPERAIQKKTPPPIPPKPCLQARSKLPKPPSVPTTPPVGSSTEAAILTSTQTSSVGATGHCTVAPSDADFVMPDPAEPPSPAAGQSHMSLPPSSVTGLPQKPVPAMKPALPPKPPPHILKSKLPKHLRKFNFAQAKTNTMMIPEEEHDIEGRQGQRTRSAEDRVEPAGRNPLAPSIHALQMDSDRREYPCDTSDTYPERLMVEIEGSDHLQPSSEAGLPTEPQQENADLIQQRIGLGHLDVVQPQSRVLPSDQWPQSAAINVDENDPLLAQIMIQSQQESLIKQISGHDTDGPNAEGSHQGGSTLDEIHQREHMTDQIYESEHVADAMHHDEHTVDEMHQDKPTVDEIHHGEGIADEIHLGKHTAHVIHLSTSTADADHQGKLTAAEIHQGTCTTDEIYLGMPDFPGDTSSLIIAQTDVKSVSLDGTESSMNISNTLEMEHETVDVDMPQTTDNLQGNANLTSQTNQCDVPDFSSHSPDEHADKGIELEVDSTVGQAGPVSDGSDAATYRIGAGVTESEVKTPVALDVANTTTTRQGARADSGPNSDTLDVNIASDTTVTGTTSKVADDTDLRLNEYAPFIKECKTGEISQIGGTAMSVSDSSETGSMEYTMSDIEELDLLDDGMEFEIPDVIITMDEQTAGGSDGEPSDKVPGVDKVPDVNKVPDVDKVLDVDEVRDIEKVDDVDSIPDAENIPSVDNIPDIENIADVDKVPDVDEAPDVDKFQDVDKVPDTDKVPDVDRAPDVDEAPDVDKFQCRQGPGCRQGTRCRQGPGCRLWTSFRM